MLAHSWTYQPLLADLLSLEMNQVELTIEEENAAGGSSSQVKSFNLDSSKDAFWRESMSLQFPVVMRKAAALENEYRAAKERLQRMQGSGGGAVGGGVSGSVGGVDSHDRVIDQTKELSSIASSLPEIQEKKRLIDTHINTCTAMTTLIHERNIDFLHQLEETVLFRSPTSSMPDAETTILQAIREKGSPVDKLRLYLIYFYENENIPKETVELLEQALIEAGVENLSTIVQHVRQIKMFSKRKLPTIVKPTSASSSVGAATGTLFARGYDHVAGLFSAGVQLINSVGAKDYMLTRTVATLMSAPVLDPQQYVTLDPKLPSGAPSTPSSPFRNVIVFVVGGGSYVEYQNLLNLAERQAEPTSIIYGSSQMISPAAFLDQIAQAAS